MLKAAIEILVVTLWTGVLTFGLMAQEVSEGSGQTVGEDPQEEAQGLPTWRPRGGSLFGTSGSGVTTPSQQTNQADWTTRPLHPEQEVQDDTRPELLVFDLFFDDGVRFSENYQSRLERAFQDSVQQSLSYRQLTPRERRRRLTEASQLVGDEVSDDYAEEIAEAIGVEYYLVPRIQVEDSRNYRISVTFGRAGGGIAERVIHQGTSNRIIDNVERQLERLTEQALISPEE